MGRGSIGLSGRSAGPFAGRRAVWAGAVCGGVLIALGLAGPVRAAGCAANTSVAAACDDLVLNTSIGTVTVDADVGGGNAIHVTSGSNATITTLDINAAVNGSSTAVTNRSGNTITNLNINATASVVGGWATIYNEWGGSIGTVTVNGTVQTSPTSGNGGIYNDSGTIGTVKNLKLGSTLSYAGNMASVYTFALNGTEYSSFAFVNGAGWDGAASFQIDPSSGVVGQLVYGNIITGLSAADFVETSGVYMGLDWSFVNSSGSNWDLVFASLPYDGPSAEASEAAVRAMRSALDGVLGSEMARLAGLAEVDCDRFDRRNLCLTVQGGLTEGAVAGTGGGTGLFAAAVRVGDGLRAGVFAEATGRASGTAGGVRRAGDRPRVGVFAGFGPGAEGTGWQGRITAATGRGAVSVTRDADLFADSEAGSGRADLEGRLLAASIGWSHAAPSGVVVTPFAGLRRITVTRGGYVERTTDAVQFPIRYDAYVRQATTATVGIRLAGPLTERVAYAVTAGVEQDLRGALAAFSGTSDIDGLDAFALAAEGGQRDSRAFGSVALSQTVSDNLRLTGQVGWRSTADRGRAEVTATAGVSLAF